MSYKPVNEAFWTDPKVRNLSLKNKLLFLYFITNPHAHYCGLYYLPEPMILFETGMSQIEYQEGIDTLSIGYQVLIDQVNSIVWVVNMGKFQLSSQQQITGAIKHIKELQKTYLKQKFVEKYPKFENEIDTLSIPYAYPIDTLSIQEKEKEEEEEEEEVIVKKADNISSAKKRRSKISDEEFFEALKKNPAFSHLNIDHEINKMKAWLLDKPGRQLTRKFITTWLLRDSNKPVEIGSQEKSENDKYLERLRNEN